jgi:putative heme-binding domain-containing protein
LRLLANRDLLGRVKPRSFLALLLCVLGALTPALAQIVTQPPVPEWMSYPQSAVDQTNYFRKTFSAQLPLLKAILLGAAEGKMVVKLNGQVAGEIVGRERATSLDVTRLIREGDNVLTISALNPAGITKVSCLLELNADFAKVRWVISDPEWQTALNEDMKPEIPARSLGRVDATPETNPFDPKRAFDAYNSWKLALGTSLTTDPSTFNLLPGFKAELIRSAQPGEGSWVSMAFDPQGRLTLARESRGLLRMTLLGTQVTKMEVIEDTLLECRGLLYAFGALYVNANNSKGFYRLRDQDEDGRFEDVQLLLRTGGGVGHGRNHVVAGPDGKIYLVHGNNVQLPKQDSFKSLLRDYQNDALIPCPWDDAMFDGDVTLPAGHILRTDPEGKFFELFAGGFRNPFDVAFNADGEMFTFDADMEWDVGAPWYRPNRVNHVLPGADFGWRRGTAKWPDYLPDTLPSTLDIGLASPTGVEFGTKSHFPPPYQQAFFIADWAYGRILAVHLKPNGASYTGTSELFVSGRPLNVTDFTFGPDGAMYLITGGRTTQSGLYRIAYNGPAVPPKSKSAAERTEEAKAKKARALRRQLESIYAGTNSLTPERILKTVWPHLGDPDPAIRHAARMALESVDVNLWQKRGLAEGQVDIALTASLGLARWANTDLEEPLLEKLNRLPLARLTPAQQLQAFRIYEVACARMGKPSAARLDAMRAQLAPLYPSSDWQLNHRLCVLLVYLESPQVLPKTLGLAAQTSRSEDLLQYLFNLRYVRQGWTIPERAAFLQTLVRAEQQPGARDYYSVLKRVRDDFMKSLSETDNRQLEPLLHIARQSLPQLNTNLAPGQVSHEWHMADFNFSQPPRGHSPEKGKAAFIKAQCIVCHRLGNEGGLVGPDLSQVGSRFDQRALLESILEPSKVIDEKFRNILFTLKDGSTLTGTIEQESETKIIVRESPFAEKANEILKRNITRREQSTVSPMPAGLINILTREEVTDLVAFLAASGVAPQK